MMADDTATQTPPAEAPPLGQDSPTPPPSDAAPSAPVLGDEGNGDGGPAETPDGDASRGTGEPGPAEQQALPENWRSHPDATAHYQDLEKRHGREKRDLERSSAEATQNAYAQAEASNAVKTFGTTIAENLNQDALQARFQAMLMEHDPSKPLEVEAMAEQLTKKAIERITGAMAQNESWGQLFGGQLKDAGAQEQSQKITGLLTDSLTEDAADELRDFNPGSKPGEDASGSWLTKRDELKEKPLRDKITELEAKVERIGEEGTAAERQNGTQAAGVGAGGAGGGGRDPSDIIRDGKATLEQKEAAYKRKHGIDFAEAAPVR